MKLKLESAPLRQRAQGFTLIEAITVIVLVGIIGGMVAVFMKNPIDAYVDTERRGELVAIADSASRFMAREIQNAVPNSVRVSNCSTASTGFAGFGSNCRYLEFVPILAAGRYRRALDASGTGRLLDVDNLTMNPDFDVLGPIVYTFANGNSLVVGNLGQPKISDVYATDASSTRRAVTGFTSPNVTFTVDGKFPTPSPGSRFQIANVPITYECTPGSGSAGTLKRYTGYGWFVTQPTSFVVKPSLIADKVSGCSFTYLSSQQSLGLVTIRLDITAEGETVRLQTQVNVDNTP